MLPLLSFIRPKKKIYDGRYAEVDACQVRRRHTNKICTAPTRDGPPGPRAEPTRREPGTVAGQAEGQQGRHQSQGKAAEVHAEGISTQQQIKEEDTKAEGRIQKESPSHEEQGVLGIEVEISQTQSLLPVTAQHETARSGDANTSALGYEGPNPYAQYLPPGQQPPPPPNYGNQPPPSYSGQGMPNGGTSMQLGYSYDSPPHQMAGGHEPPPGYSIQEAVTSPYQNPQTHIIYVYQHPSPHQPYSQRESRASEPPQQEITTTTVIYLLPKPLEDPQKRREFVRKTYSVLFLQLLFTSLVVAACTFIQPVKAWVYSHHYFSLIFFFLYLSALILVCMLTPYMLNTNCFSVFVLILLTVAMAGMAGMITATKAQEVVILAAGSTTIAVFVMTVMACVCVDFTPYTYIVLVISLIVMLFGCFAIFLVAYIPMIRLVYSVVMALVICVYIIIDTQMIIGGKTHELDTNMYIFGSIMLYIDIILLFFYILDILDN